MRSLTRSGARSALRSSTCRQHHSVYGRRSIPLLAQGRRPKHRVEGQPLFARLSVPTRIADAGSGRWRRVSPAGSISYSISVRTCTALSRPLRGDRKSTRLNSSHLVTSYAVFCVKKKNELLRDRRGDLRTSAVGPVVLVHDHR